MRLWSKLDHENILPLLGYFLEGQKALPNLVSEWMEDGTLIDYMKNHTLDVFEICNMVSTNSCIRIQRDLSSSRC